MAKDLPTAPKSVAPPPAPPKAATPPPTRSALAEVQDSVDVLNKRALAGLAHALKDHVVPPGSPFIYGGPEAQDLLFRTLAAALARIETLENVVDGLVVDKVL